MQDDAVIAQRSVTSNTRFVKDGRRFNFFIIQNQLFDNGIAAKIGPSAFVVYAYLLRRAGNNLSAWPKYETIAEDCGISVRSVHSSLKKLAANQLISMGRKQYGYIFEILDARYVNTAHQENEPDMQEKSGDVQLLQVPTKEKNTHEEDTNKPTKKIHGISLVDLPEDISSEVATEFIQHRKLIKKPLTQKAFDRAMTIAAGVSVHRGLARLKYTPDQCITATIDAGWQGINLDWIYNRAMGTSYSKPAEPRRPQPDLT